MSKYFTDWAKQFKSGGLVGEKKNHDKNKEDKITRADLKMMKKTKKKGKK